MDGFEPRFLPNIRLVSVLVVLAIAGLATTDNQESKTVELKICYNGGTMSFESCICRYGYTGEACEISLNKQRENEKGFNMLMQKTSKLFDMQYYFGGVEYKAISSINIHRLKRQANSGSEGSGSTTDTPSSCPAGQILSGDRSSCIFAATFVVQITVNETFLAAYSDLQSSLSQTFIDEVTTEIQQQLADASFISMEITSLQNGSVIVNADMNFEDGSDLTTIEVNLLLRNRLGRISRFSNIAAGDKNECNTADICGSNTTCTNLDGSFSCACSFGFRETSSSNSVRRKQCEFSCKNIECLNGGMCMASDGNEVFCSCTDGYGGPRCEQSFFRWRQATIGVVVVLVVTLLVITVGLIYYFYRIKDVKHKSPQVLLGTGFKSVSDHNLQTHTNPYQVDDSKHLSNFTFEQEHYINGKYTNTAAEEFKPDGIKDDRL